MKPVQKEEQKTVSTLPDSDRVKACLPRVLEKLKREMVSHSWAKDTFATIELRVSTTADLIFTLKIEPTQSLSGNKD
jgi:hypothetical protein